MFNFIDTCRLCTTDTKNGGIDCISSEKLHNIIRQLYQIDITANDQLSKEICNACYESVTKFYFHYEIVKTAQKNQHQFLKMQLKMAKPKTESPKDDDSDVEFVPLSSPTPTPSAPTAAPPSQSTAKKENGNIKCGNGGSDKEHSVGNNAITRNSIDGKRSSTSITIKNSNNKPVISRTTSMARSSPALTTKRILNLLPKPPVTEQQKIDATAAAAAAAAKLSTQTVNVVTRQTDGTVILRKVQMTSKQNVVAMKRPSANHLLKTVQSKTATAASINGPSPKRIRFDDRLAASPALRPKDIEPQRKTLPTTITTTTTTTTTAATSSNSSAKARILLRPRSGVEINRITTKQRRIVSADDKSQDTDKMITMTPLSASEHQYAKRNNDNEASTPDTDKEKPSPQTPLSATEHHYSKRNNDNVPISTSTRNRWRPMTSTATVVATAADSTRTDEIKIGSMTMAPSSPILLNQMLNRIKPSIRVRSVHSLNNNAKNG